MSQLIKILRAHGSRLCADAADVIEAQAKRIDELLTANTRDVDRRRAAEAERDLARSDADLWRSELYRMREERQALCLELRRVRDLCPQMTRATEPPAGDPQPRKEETPGIGSPTGDVSDERHLADLVKRLNSCQSWDQQTEDTAFLLRLLLESRRRCREDAAELQALIGLANKKANEIQADILKDAIIAVEARKLAATCAEYKQRYGRMRICLVAGDGETPELARLIEVVAMADGAAPEGSAA